MNLDLPIRRHVPSTRPLSPIALTALVLAASLAAAAEPTPPSSYVDDGACPFECCHYGDWSVRESTDLRAAPKDSAAVVATVRPGQRVAGLTGKVVIDKPGEIRVVRDTTSADSGHRYRRGDRVFVYTSEGEGMFKLWHRGEMFVDDAAFLLDGDGGYVACVHDGGCWGEKVSLPVSTWWVQVKSAEGIVGWSRQPERFGNMDGCGASE